MNRGIPYCTISSSFSCFKYDFSAMGLSGASPMNKKQINIYVNVHKGIRSLVGRFSIHAGATDWSDSEAVSELYEEWTKAMTLLHSHQQHEDKFIHPQRSISCERSR